MHLGYNYTLGKGWALLNGFAWSIIVCPVSFTMGTFIWTGWCGGQLKTLSGELIVFVLVFTWGTLHLDQVVNLNRVIVLNGYHPW